MSETIIDKSELVTIENPELVIVDFDRTLFDVNNFWSDFLATVEDQLEVDADEVQQLYSTPRKHDEPYSPFATIAELLGQTELTDSQLRELRDNLKDNAQEYLVKGAASLFNRARAAVDVTIITVGHEGYQKFKYDLVADLLHNDMHEQLESDDFVCVAGSKVEAIQNRIDQKGVDIQKTVYIDDRPGHIAAAEELIQQGLIAVWFNSPVSKLGREETEPLYGRAITRLGDVVFIQSESNE